MKTLRLRGVVARWHAIADELWQISLALPTTRDLARNHRRAERLDREVRALCERNDVGPDALPGPSRQAWASAALLADPERHERAAAHLRLVADECVAKQVRIAWWRVGMTRTLWRRRVRRGAVEVSTHLAFIAAPPPIVRRLVGSIAPGRRDAEAERIVVDWTTRGQLAVLDQVLEASFADGARAARGEVHDLDELFAAINAQHFDSALARPTLRWSERPTVRKMGHYDFARDEVVISSTLDASDVPRFVVEFVVYHELLHKKHGARRRGRQLHAHTPAFRRDEERFPDFRDAEAELSRIASRHRQRTR